MERRKALESLLLLATGGVCSEALADGRRPTRALPVPRAFYLDDDTKSKSRRALLSELEGRLSASRRTLGDVLRDLNRKGKPARGSLRLYSSSDKSEKARYPIGGGFIWDRSDSRSTNWYPQGISGSGDAYASGTIGGRRVVLVSWYARRTPNKGVRLSVVDVSSAETVRYRHVLLVEPVATPNGATFRPVQVHAGGIALYRNLLYVVDTERGIRVFDTKRIFQAAPDSSKVRVGVRFGKAYAFNYKYALPMVVHYEQPVTQRMRFSFVSLDRTVVPHGLWVGEYEEASAEGFAARFSLAAERGGLVEELGRATSVLSLRLNRERTQGFVAAHGTYVLNHTYARDPYRLHVQTPNGYSSLRAPYGLEDLYYDPTLNRLWMQTEHPKSRAVFFNTAPDELK